MYVITFYSFKGGVGRTMALANVGLELARTGRRVLLVDFDLEAPGLDTFEILRPHNPTPGIVDYIRSYRQTGTAPDLAEFVYEPQIITESPGRLWVMPTGRQDDQYANRFSDIDWQELYSEQDGYLLLEDLRAQWQRTLSPDYVLIDSRTGHTDVGGICTRQLPDAVAILFFPNEQNRRGIELIVKDVRKEQQESKRKIQLYFIASNVPNLDDEELILRDRLRHFRKTIDYPRLDGTIHHYDSLSLLQQTVFTVERPQTRLAREYRRITERLIGDNLGDRRVVLDTLARLSRGDDVVHAASIAEMDIYLKDILTRYSQDSEVVHSLAQANEFLGKPEVAKLLFADAKSLGFETADVLIERAISYYDAGSKENARDALKRATLQSAGQVFKLARAFTLVLERDVGVLADFVEMLNSTNIRPRDRVRISKLIMTKNEALAAVDRLLAPAVQSTEDVADRESASYELALCRIAQSRFKEAMTLIASDRAFLGEMGIEGTFNYAMAEWGATNQVPVDLFEQVLRFHQDSPRDAGPNYFQCVAIALWANGRVNDAKTAIESSLQALTKSDATFSVWRYLYVDCETFAQDLSSLQKMVDGGGDRPVMFR
jgi:MinD-like ATPase involved in chromosome partitioning or flagellar assembly